MGNLQYVVDLIKQALEWINSAFEKCFPNLKGKKLWAAKATALLAWAFGAYLLTHPAPWEQQKALHTLTQMHSDCVKGDLPEWPLDWKPIPVVQDSEEKSDKDKDDEDTAKASSAGKTSKSIAPIDKASNLLAAEKYEAAAKLLSRMKSSSEGEDKIPVVNNLGIAELHLGRYKDAIDDLTLACKLKEDLRASLEKKSGTKSLLSGAEISSEANLGEAYFFAGKLNEANEHLTTADNGADAVQEQLNPCDKAEIAYFLGLTDLMQQRVKAAIKDLQKATKLEDESLKSQEKAEKISNSELSNWAACNTVLGIALQANGEIAQSLRMYKEVSYKINNNLTILTPESRKFITDCEQTTMSLWDRVVLPFQPTTPPPKSED